MSAMEVSVLGPVRVLRDGLDVDLGTPRQRAVIAALLLSGGRPVPSEVVIERVWGERPPAGALATLHGYVAALRRALEPDRPPRAPSTVLVTRGDAYHLAVPPDARDDVRFEASLASARRLLDVVPDHLRPQVAHDAREQVEAALDQLDAATSAWTGTPYAELGDDAGAAAQRARLEGQLVTAHELRAVAHLALGRHDLVLAELEEQTARFALHERWWALRALALARAGRQADALACLAEVRARLAEELGVDPSPALQDLQGAILRQEQTVVDAAPAHPETGPSAVAPARDTGGREVDGWAMTGRADDLAALREALAHAGRGRPGFVAITGEPGIGKTRLARELAVEASAAGWSVALGRCSQDDGAPALWPWRSVLRTLGRAVEPEEGTDAGGLFRVRADLVGAVTDVASERPVLVLLDDLHWADASSLAVLRLLVETVSDHRLLVVATWRTVPHVSREVGLVAETFARHQAVRRTLVGLDPAQSLALFADVAGDVLLSDELGAELARRTDGNPFFVVEFARLLSDGRHTDPAELLAGTAPPTAVLEVVGRRVEALPDAAVTVLRSAAIIGRTFALDTLAEVTAIDADEVLDLVEPAVRAGLLVESGIEEFSFAHALVRDTLHTQMSATRMARTHAVVAELLAGRPGREHEVARHWRAAGPAHAGRAWRALVEAAGAASAGYAHDDAIALLDEALTVQAGDAASGPRDRAGVLERQIQACRWAGLLPRLVPAVEELVEVASDLDDDRLAAWAATQVVRGMGWRSAGFGAVNERVVGALRRARQHLPADDLGLRAVVAIALMRELGHLHPMSERIELRVEALDLARRSGDPDVLGDVLYQAALHQPLGPVDDMLALNAEAVALARSVGDGFALSMRLAERVFLLSAAGDLDGFTHTLAEARRVTARTRVMFADMVLDEQEVGWASSQGRFADCERIIEVAHRRLAVLSAADPDGLTAVAEMFDLHCYHVWRGRPLDALPGIRAERVAGLPCLAFEVVALWRAGEHAAARDLADRDQLRAGLELTASFSLPIWCHTAEVALHLGDEELARRCYDQVLPYAGDSSGADGRVFGPTDAFLALAARATGDLAGARRHADDAIRIIDGWGQRPVRAWFDDLRATYGF
jgi:DNA-binding SARP family transcriptional activator